MLFRASPMVLALALFATNQCSAKELLPVDYRVDPVVVVASYQYGSCRFIAAGQEPGKRTGFAFKRCKELPKELVKQLHKAGIDARLVEFDPQEAMEPAAYKQAYRDFLSAQLASSVNHGRYILSYQGLPDAMDSIFMPLHGAGADHPSLGVLVFGQQTLNWRGRRPLRPKNIFELGFLVANTLKGRCVEASPSDCSLQGYLLATSPVADEPTP